MSQQEISRRLATLRASFDGDPWHGPSLWSLLEDVSAATAFRKSIPDVHSIWELVLHMTYWRRAAIDALSDLSIKAFQPNTPEDWRSPETADEANWNTAREALRTNQSELLRVLESLQDADLDRTVKGRSYAYDVVVLGILQHDVYHAGQISWLRKMGASGD